MEGYEKEKIEASDLLDMQRGVSDAEAAEGKAWGEYQDAMAQLPFLKQLYESRKWDAECARQDLRNMKEAIEAQS